MKISAQWVLDQLPWLNDISPEEICKRFSILEHSMKISEDIWVFTPRSHRTDLYSANGFLREISAAFHKSYLLPMPQVQEEDVGSIYEQADADVWSDALCNRLTVKMGIDICKGKTPAWMNQRLTAAGLACHNNICDITNYVYLEYGQPILLLDASAIYDGTLTLREAMGFESANDIALPYGTPVLESGEEILAVPHLWVSSQCAVSDNTRSVMIVAVNYPEDVISLCGETFGAALKPTDPLLTIVAVERVCQLVQELGYGRILDGAIDILNFVPNPKTLDFSAESSAAIGISQEEFFTYSALIGITREGVIPSWRPDLNTTDSVLREIALLHQANT